MKILFVCGGNNPSGISSVVKSQGKSLEKLGLEIDYFTINGKGPINYLKHIRNLPAGRPPAWYSHGIYTKCIYNTLYISLDYKNITRATTCFSIKL